MGKISNIVKVAKVLTNTDITAEPITCAVCEKPMAGGKKRNICSDKCAKAAHGFGFGDR